MLNRNKHKISPSIYFRLDERETNNIFKNGFSAQFPLKLNQSEWWACSFNQPKSIYAPDVNPGTCVCLSTNLSSCAYFPYDPDNINANSFKQHHIYLIAGPSANKINMKGKLFEDQIIPENLHNAIIDVHSLQMSVVNSCINGVNKIDPYRTDPNTVIYNAIGLCGYEAIAYKILPEQIIGAVTIERKQIFWQDIKVNWPASVTLGIPYYDFEVIGFTPNPNFSNKTSMNVTDGSTVSNLKLDYSQLENKTRSYVQMLLKERYFRTPKITDAFGGKIVPITENTEKTLALVNPIKNSTEKMELFRPFLAKNHLLFSPMTQDKNLKEEKQSQKKSMSSPQ